MENLDTNRENALENEKYWRENHSIRPYYADFKKDIPDLDYDKDLSSAYQFGRNARSEYQAGSNFEDNESDLEQKWNNFKAESRLKWEQAKLAVKDAWDRM